MKKPLMSLFVLALSLSYVSSATAAPVYWVDWTSGTSGTNGSATGVLDINGTLIDVNYQGEVAFIQTTPGGGNYWIPSAPYISPQVDNAPSTTDIIALSQNTSKTVTFSQPIQDLFFAIVSLNGNGYLFDNDFEVVSFGQGYWGDGNLTKQNLGGGQYELDGTGEAHGVIRFTGAVSSLTWTSLTNEYWNGFTLGTYGKAPDPEEPNPIPEPATGVLMLGALLGFVARRRRTWP